MVPRSRVSALDGGGQSTSSALRPPELISFAIKGEDSIGVSLQSIASGLAYACFSLVSSAVPKHGARISNETMLRISVIELSLDSYAI